MMKATLLLGIPAGIGVLLISAALLWGQDPTHARPSMAGPAVAVQSPAVGTPASATMNRHEIDPKKFDGRKFAKRYGLKRGEFWIEYGADGTCYLHVPAGIQSPVFEAPDARGPRIRIVWQEIPELVPRTEVRELIPGLTREQIDRCIQALKARGAVSVEVVK